MRLWSAAVSAVLASCILSGQTTAPPLSFEVASVKPASAPIATVNAYSEGYNAGARAALASFGLRISGQRVRVTDNTLRDLVRLAYQVKEYQISGPPWITTEKYEIDAMMPSGAKASQAPEMLRTLLEQRFHLVLRRESRNSAVYALVLAKGGPKMTAVTGPAGRTVFAGSITGRVHANAASVATFAELLAKASDRPVVDMTGLTGLYNFDLTYTPELSAAPADAPPALPTALQEQLGLRLEKREMPIEFLVIDRADKVPTEN
ncbi:conserved exported hypothetical protein [Candidatus Sulfopaludibacter sp. SbA3]|nr:conserved exported hypothetical protein [Candidatus Sulfopaludibacter sp. SbA3]